MHPAPSVIIFTTLSGLGFGLFMWLGLGTPNVTGLPAFIWFFVAYALSVGGLIASTFHLGNRKNAIYAFSQWRTSWLSREGIMAVLTLLTFAPYAIGLIFLGRHWPLLGNIGTLFALITVFTTSMMYAQLKTVPRWRMIPVIPLLFELYAIAGGALLAGEARVAGWLILVLTGLQIAAWMMGDAKVANLTTNKGTATGLGRFGSVRMLESGHTARSYVMDEMVHMIGRKHAQKLRVISALLIGAIPAALLLFLPAGPLVILLAVASHVIGVATSRWLFFAEAEHVVGMYSSRG